MQVLVREKQSNWKIIKGGILLNELSTFERKEINGKAVGSLLIGIISLLGLFLVGSGGILSVAGLFLGVFSLKDKQWGRNVGLTGIALNLIGVFSLFL